MTSLNNSQNTILSAVKKYFGIISVADVKNFDAIYILSDGSILNTFDPTTHNSQHINVAKFISKTFGLNDSTTDASSDADGSITMNEINAIRVTNQTNLKAIFVPLKMPTDAQLEKLVSIIVEWTKQPGFSGVHISNLDGDQSTFKVYSSSFSADPYGFAFDVEDIVTCYYRFKIMIENRDFPSSSQLNEDSRTSLIVKSRGKGMYKDRTRGKNRFERKKFSKVANSVKQYNQINMNNLFKSDILQVEIPITGETNDYTVSVKMNGVIAEIAKNIKNNNNKFEFRTVIQALTKVFNTTDIFVKCTCPDYKFNYAHWNIINKVSVDDTAHDPGPGKGIANPNDEKGRGCKHVLLVLANGDWLMKVASVINNYVHYAEEHLQKPFLKLIFPKLYGIPADEAVEEDLIDDDKYLDSSKGFIDAINEYGRNRGKIKKGSNKNPIAEKEKNTQMEENKYE